MSQMQLRRMCCVLLLFGALSTLRDAVGDSQSSSSAAALPGRLSETGFFAVGSRSEARPDLLAFAPQYPLWSDGTTKRRWIELPPGTSIDASDPNAWEFPRGTRLYKEFALERRIETRLIERVDDGSWRFGTYVWNDEQDDAVLAPESGVRSLSVDDAPGGRYTIPSESDCRACHEGARVPVLGFSALQLSPDRDPLAPHASKESAANLAQLVTAGVLRGLPHELRERPPRIAARSPTERAALGYLHGNCGHCHVAPSDTDAAVPVGVRLAQEVGTTTSSADVIRTLLNAPTRYRVPAGAALPTALAHAIVPGAPERSVLIARMWSRDPRERMPPIGTTIPDSIGLALIERWIVERSSESQPLIEEIHP